jgi:predicted nucleic acid-binding protein
MVLYQVEAQVVDISTDGPVAADKFFVDSNVWFWMHYTKASQAGLSAPYQVSAYSTYMDRARQVKARFVHSGITLAELAHRIEHAEFEIWKGISKEDVGLKHFRHSLREQRAEVVDETVLAWRLIETWSEIAECAIDRNVTEASLARIERFCIDGHDALLVATLRAAAITQVITDDADFVTVPHLQVFTANKAALRSAEMQGKLTRRH